LKERIFFPNLDGLRFLAFLGVFIAHYIQRIPGHETNYLLSVISHTGEMGVNFFFCLSSFLITYLLLKEYNKTGTISIKGFYIRRILRIWPLYYLIVFLGIVILPLFKNYFPIPTERANPLYFIFFIYNFEPVVKGLWDASNIGFVWSIAIEEQFYMIWPLIILFINIRRKYLIFITIIAISMTFRIIYHSNYLVLTYHTLSVFSDMGIGGLIAWLAINKPGLIRKLDNKNVIRGFYLIGLLLFFLRPVILAYPIINIFERLLYSLIFCFFIIEQNFYMNSFYKIGKFTRITDLGKITYGLYMYHMFPVFLVNAIFVHYLGIFTQDHLILSFLLQMVIALAMVITIASLSYNLFEKKFLQLKERYSFFSIKSNS
jgi:peptidoglycan/LPS O-acetylase OafA/YrhL